MKENLITGIMTRICQSQLGRGSSKTGRAREEKWRKLAKRRVDHDEEKFQKQL